MTSEKELRLLIGGIIRAHRQKDDILLTKLQTRFAKELEEFSSKQPIAAARVRKLYEKWLAWPIKKSMQEAVKKPKPRKRQRRGR